MGFTHSPISFPPLLSAIFLPILAFTTSPLFVPFPFSSHNFSSFVTLCYCLIYNKIALLIIHSESSSLPRIFTITHVFYMGEKNSCLFLYHSPLRTPVTTLEVRTTG